jgi:hypothetical protein
MDSWRTGNLTKSYPKTKPDQETYGEDYKLSVAGKEIVIHQKNIGWVENDSDLGSVGRIIWDAVKQHLCLIISHITCRAWFYANTSIEIQD